MKRLLRILLCIVASFVGLYLSGFGWLMADMTNESRMIWLFFGTSLLLATVFVLPWESYLYGKAERQELSERVSELETEVRRLGKQEKSQE